MGHYKLHSYKCINADGKLCYGNSEQYKSEVKLYLTQYILRSFFSNSPRSVQSVERIFFDQNTEIDKRLKEFFRMLTELRRILVFR